MEDSEYSTGDISVLLVEPYVELRELFQEILGLAGYRVAHATSWDQMKTAIAAKRYDCVLINIDQNRSVDYGLKLADQASAAGARIIMIPDHTVDRAMIAAKGWLQLTKPFSIRNIRAVLTEALGVDGTAAEVKRRAGGHAAARRAREARNANGS